MAQMVDRKSIIRKLAESASPPIADIMGQIGQVRVPQKQTRRGVAATKLIGDRFFLNVPLRFAAVRASGCSVPAR